MAVASQHIFRAVDGRPVPAGHLDAAVLAYAPGDDVPDSVLAELEAGAVAAEAKQARRPANKAMKAQDQKDGGA